MRIHRRIALLALVVTAAPALTAIPSRAVLGGKAVVMVADLAYAFPEARPRIVAVAGTDQGLGSFLGAVDPGFPSKPVLDRSANAEAFAALKPDLVVLKSSMKKSLGAQLDALDLHPLYLNLETPDDYFRDLAAFGSAFAAGARADELAAYYRSVLERVEAGVAKAASRSGAAAPRILLVQASLASGGAFDVPPKSWMQSALVGLAGGEGLWFGANPGEGWARVGFEQIAAWNPDVLIVIDYREGVDATVAGLRKDPRFASLACGATGRILGFPQDWYSWDQPDTRWGLGLLWLAKALRPAAFPDIDVVSEARSFYRLFYGFDSGAFDALVLPRLKGDYALGK